MPPKRKPNEDQSLALYEQAEKLLHNPAYSDVSILCKGTVWRCQRAILCEGSQFFKATLTKSFSETETREIDMTADEPDAVELLLHFIYTRQYPPLDQLVSHSIFNGYMAIQIADKYDVPELKKAAIESIIRQYRDDSAYWWERLAKSKFRHTEKIWNLEVSGMEVVRQAIVEVMVKHSKRLLGGSNLVDLLQRCPSFMKQYLEAVREKLPENW